MSVTAPKVGLFVTCLVDLMRPSVGFAAVKLLRQAGCRVCVPPSQICCGQPAYNSGDRTDASAIARQVIEAFEEMDYLVAPSGSCAGTIKNDYPGLFVAGSSWRARAEKLSKKTYELVSFLTDVMGLTATAARFEGLVTYHDSCSGLRQLDVREQPRRLLASVEGLTLRELPDADVCCGFGGTFCVKYPEISNKMVETKVRQVEETGAELLLAGDLGCLLNMAGKLKRLGSAIEVRHVAEVLAGALDQPAIGEAKTD